MGHIHPQVSDTRQAVDSYHGQLGFDITAEMPGAVFASAGGYHHHLGLNSWNSRGAAPAPAGSAGLESFVIQVPNEVEQAGLAEQPASAGQAVSQHDGPFSVRDPWNMEVILRPARPATAPAEAAKAV
jgi:catechol 2,3-dioxygenase